ncbi:hypothetical protein NDU88_000796 [Pleurodeles waltl]|uniref:Uncharacterized protein n=1 Tax=Pleurodeles waltl TaxID=8319 RepID=A0AAV7VYB4_PLEWA|nr:hypothetical protein NDU88_000796 [Pleurodeles waltl]
MQHLPGGRVPEHGFWAWPPASRWRSHSKSAQDPSVIHPNPATITDPLESSTKIRRRWGSFPAPVGPGPRPEDTGLARGKGRSRTQARAAERRRVTLRTGARPRRRAFPAGSSRDRWNGEKRGALPPPSAPRGNRGCRDREESPKKKAVTRRGAPWSEHLRKCRSLGLGGMSTRGPHSRGSRAPLEAE